MTADPSRAPVQSRRRTFGVVPLITAVIALFALTGGLAGCGGSDAASSGSTGAPGSSADTATFPVTVTGSNGQVSIPKRPERIVSLSPSATEMLFAVGAGKQVIAVDDQSTYPADAPKTSLSGFKPNAEAVIGYKPDLVVIADDANGLLAALGKVGVPVLQETAAATLDDTYAQLEAVGAATGHGPDAGKVVADTKKRIADIVSSTKKPAQQLSYYHELDNTYFSATSKTFIGSVYSLFGLRNIADPAAKAGNEYPQLSAEYVVKANPDLVFLADTRCCQQTPATVAARPGWTTVTAVTGNGVIALDDDVASRWGPRVADLVQTIASAVSARG
jgi:iron complex transport system substrate-binding protein